MCFASIFVNGADNSANSVFKVVRHFYSKFNSKTLEKKKLGRDSIMPGNTLNLNSEMKTA